MRAASRASCVACSRAVPRRSKVAWTAAGLPSERPPARSSQADRIGAGGALHAARSTVVRVVKQVGLAAVVGAAVAIAAATRRLAGQKTDAAHAGGAGYAGPRGRTCTIALAAVLHVVAQVGLAAVGRIPIAIAALRRAGDDPLSVDTGAIVGLARHAAAAAVQR